MRALYFDCFSGISGDMTLGALLDLGIDREVFLGELEKLGIGGYKISFRKSVKNGITGNYVKVELEAEVHGGDAHHHHPAVHDGSKRQETSIEQNDCGNSRQKDLEPGTGHVSVEYHNHSHAHVHRGLGEIEDLIMRSTLSKRVKDLACRIFRRVAEAEAKVHNRSIEEVHFHEVGAIDSIVDIVGCAILIDMLKPEVIYASTVNEGRGFIHCQHGRLAVPVPAVSEIFASSGVVFQQIDVDTELVTPTGAAIIAELAVSFGNMPRMKPEKIGWGAGTKDLPIPNLLKVTMGEVEEKIEDSPNLISVMETNLDDCTGEQLGDVMGRLFDGGALDVFFTPVFMKKNRPAYCLTILTRRELETKMEQILFKHTSTIGVRKRTESRTVCEREKDVVLTPFGELEVKRVWTGSGVRLYPEYESARKLAKESGESVIEIYKSLPYNK